MKKRLSVPVPVLGSILIAAGLVIYALSIPHKEVPAEQEFRAMRVKDAVAFPVVRIP